MRDRFRLGEPALLIGDAPDLEPGEAQLRDSLTGDVILHRNELALLLGDGDTGKSMVALVFGALIHAGRTDIADLAAMGTHVGYADWETSAGIQKSRLKRMFGEFYPKSLVYRKLGRSTQPTGHSSKRDGRNAPTRTCVSGLPSGSSTCRSASCNASDCSEQSAETFDSRDGPLCGRAFFRNELRGTAADPMSAASGGSLPLR